MRKTVAIILSLAMVLFAAYKIKVKIDQRRALAEGGGPRFQASLPVVQVEPLTERPIAEILQLTGEVGAETEIAVQPRMSGRLLELLVDQGQTVQANQLVAVLDDETIRLQIQQSEASMATIQANLRQAELNVARAKADQERYAELLAKRFISQREYDTYEAAHLNAQAQVEGYQAQLAAARKNHEILHTQLGYAKVYSPAAGIVLDKGVTAGMNITTGTTIVTIGKLDPIRLTVNLDQKDSSRIKRGMKARFSCDAFPDRVFTGTIREMAPSFDPQTRTMTIGADLANPGNVLLPGIFGTVEIEIGGRSSALTVPEEAVVTRNGQRGVFAVNPDRVAVFTPVTTGLSAEGRIEITSGLRPGTLVVVIGQNRLRDGQEVQMIGSGDAGGPRGAKPGVDPVPSRGRAGEGR